MLEELNMSFDCNSLNWLLTAVCSAKPEQSLPLRPALAAVVFGAGWFAQPASV